MVALDETSSLAGLRGGYSCIAYGPSSIAPDCETSGVASAGDPVSLGFAQIIGNADLACAVAYFNPLSYQIIQRLMINRLRRSF